MWDLFHIHNNFIVGYAITYMWLAYITMNCAMLVLGIRRPVVWFREAFYLIHKCLLLYHSYRNRRYLYVAAENLRSNWSPSSTCKIKVLYRKIQWFQVRIYICYISLYIYFFYLAKLYNILCNNIGLCTVLFATSVVREMMSNFLFTFWYPKHGCFSF